jgi:RNA polymerase sigma factor (sigma-70 family)
VTDLDALIRYANSVARDATMSKPWMREDAAQEGAIAAWLALRSGKGRTPAYAKTAVRNAIQNHVVRHRSTGSPRPKGGGGISVRPRDHDPLVRDGDYGPMLTADPADPAADRRLDAVDDGWLRRAVAELPEAERRYVWLRFWEGRTARQIGAETGAPEWAVVEMWHRSVRPRLKEIA